MSPQLILCQVLPPLFGLLHQPLEQHWLLTHHSCSWAQVLTRSISPSFDTEHQCWFSSPSLPISADRSISALQEPLGRQHTRTGEPEPFAGPGSSRGHAAPLMSSPPCHLHPGPANIPVSPELVGTVRCWARGGRRARDLLREALLLNGEQNLHSCIAIYLLIHKYGYIYNSCICMYLYFIHIHTYIYNMCVHIYIYLIYTYIF